MQPIINDKAVIIIDLSQKEMINNDIYVVQYEGKTWVKRYDSDNKTFISINPDFTHLVYKEENAHIIGKVLITFTNL